MTKYYDQDGFLKTLEPVVEGIVDELGILSEADLLPYVSALQNYTSLRAYAGVASKVQILESGISGLFVRDPAETAVDNGGTVIVDGLGRRWKRAFSGAKNVQWFGAKGDGVSNDTTPLLTVFAMGGAIHIPSGRYLIGAPITAVSNTHVTCEGTIVWDNPAVTTAFSIITATNVSNFTATDLSFENTTPNNSVNSMYLIACSFVTLIRPKSRMCSLVSTTSSGGSYAGSNVDVNSAGFNGCREIHITDFNCVGRGPGFHAAAITISYTVDWSIRGGRADNIHFGVQWWGGDSNHLVDGALGNERKCRNFVIEGVIATNGMAGIWGSMGQYFVVDSCIARYHTDVGIDPEGCLDGVVSNCVASHCDNGCFTGFFFNRNVSFKNNKAVQDGTRGTILFKTYNSANQDVPQYVVSDNEWLFTGVGIGVVSIDPGISSMTYRNNAHTDCVLACQTNNQGTWNLDGNEFRFTQLIPANTNVVTLGGNHGRSLSITNNKVSSIVLQNNANIAVFYLMQNDFNSTVPTRVRNNEISGNMYLVTPLRLLGVSGNGGVVMPFLIEDNVYEGDLVDISEAGRSTVVKTGNRDYFGALKAGQT